RNPESTIKTAIALTGIVLRLTNLAIRTHNHIATQIVEQGSKGNTSNNAAANRSHAYAGHRITRNRNPSNRGDRYSSSAHSNNADS
ncbi:hypothetical protein, partial [Klebsiella pneumoniae]|uniref:hypothetical protein n=1 Tax=Klebsiella pneumoniae TaxID=573 RepID=UPI00224AE34A